MNQYPALVVDPVEFLNAQPEVHQALRDRSLFGRVVVQSAGFDTYVEMDRGLFAGSEVLANEPEVEQKPITGFFGDLLQRVQTNTFLYEDCRMRVTALSSPGAANTITEHLGLIPGYDRLRLTHSEHASIPASVYVDSLRMGEYPMSIGNMPFLFEHDRVDHMVGVLLMPTEMTQRFIALAHSSSSHEDEARVAGLLDAMTARIKRIADGMTLADDGTVEHYLLSERSADAREFADLLFGSSALSLAGQRFQSFLERRLDKAQAVFSAHLAATKQNIDTLSAR